MKKLEIEKTKPTFIISAFKTDITKVGLVFQFPTFLLTKFLREGNLFTIYQQLFTYNLE